MNDPPMDCDQGLGQAGVLQWVVLPPKSDLARTRQPMVRGASGKSFASSMAVKQVCDRVAWNE